MARLDLFLKHTGLVKQRGEAKRACDEGRVWVNGQPAKASHSVKVGEVISLEMADRYLEAEILAIPERPPARRERDQYCRLLRQERRDPHLDLRF